MKRPRLQIHLSTALLCSVLAAILLGANFYERSEWRNLPWFVGGKPGVYEVRAKGFPLVLNERTIGEHWPEFVSFRPEGYTVIDPQKGAGPLQYAINIAFALFVLFAAAFGREWFLRRRERLRARATSSDSP